MVATLHELNAALSKIFSDLAAERDAAANRAMDRLTALSSEAKSVGLPLVVDEYVDTLRRMVGLPVADHSDSNFPQPGDLDSELENLLAEEDFSDDESSDDEEMEADEWSDDFDDEEAA